MNIRSRLLTASATLSLALTGHAAVVLGNTGQTTFDVDLVSEDHWLAAPFQTGADVSGYRLNSITLSFRSGGSTIANGGFALAVWSNNTGVPGSAITGGTLSGSVNPSTTGLFSYTTSTATLAPSTTYWVVASIPSGPGSIYQWAFAGSLAQDVNAPGWSIDGLYAYRTAAVWNALDSQESPFIMSIDATPVPEPSEYASVAGVGVLLAAGFLRRRKHA
jgi:hypothetical protein